MEDPAPAAILPPAASIWESMNTWFSPTVLFLFLNLMIATILFTSNLPNLNPPRKPEDQDDNKSQTDTNQSKLARSPSILHRLRSFNLYPHSHRSLHDSSPVTHNNDQLQPQDSLEIAATQYVFDHPFPHEQDVVESDSVNPNNFDVDPTRFEAFEQVPEPPPAAPATEYSDVNRTNKVRPVNAKTHFVYEPKDTVEKVTAHFNYEPDGPEIPEDLGSVEAHEEDKDEFKSFDEVYSKITGGNMNRTKSDTIPASGEVPVKLPAKMKKSASLKSAFSHFEEENIVEARRPATVREQKSAAMATDAEDVEVDARADDFINKFKHQLKLQRLDSIIRYKDMVSRGSEK